MKVKCYQEIECTVMPRLFALLFSEPTSGLIVMRLAVERLEVSACKALKGI
jgi:hypothetical protein